MKKEFTQKRDFNYLLQKQNNALLEQNNKSPSKQITYPMQLKLSWREGSNLK